MLGIAAGAVAATVGYGRYIEPAWVRVDEIVLHVPGLPARLAGKRFAQVSDLHIGAYFAPAQLLDAVERINRLGVEWLMLTGDFVTTRDRNRATRAPNQEAAAASLVEPLRRAQMPLYGAIGNHDMWAGVEMVERYLTAAGVTILRNDAVQLDEGLWLAAVDDIWSGQPDLRSALRAAPADSVNLLMAHEPDYFDTVIAQDAPVAVQFSGHSHGGQIRLPTLTPGPEGLYSFAPVLVDFGKRYPIGLRQKNDRYVYTNRGLGAWPIPYRINCPPEISVFVLQPL